MPEKIDPKKKIVLGIYREENDELIGIIDIIERLYDENTLSLGLMLLAPSYRNKGIGTIAYEKFQKWAIDRNILRIRIGVLYGNDKGLRFW